MQYVFSPWFETLPLCRVLPAVSITFITRLKMRFNCKKLASIFLISLTLSVHQTLAEDNSVPAGQAPTPATSKAEDASMFGMNLQDVLNVPVQVSSKGLVQNVRTAAGAITVIDKQMIKESGARDLLELMELIPGFQFGTDLTGGSDSSFRGLVSNGTFLLRIDGQEMNELHYKAVLIQNRYPASLIERIEVIRGPGSVVYGGSAEYAVIDVTTKRVHESNEGEATVNFGVTKDGLSRKVGTFWQSIGDKDTNLTLAATDGRIQRGSGNYTDLIGQSYNVDEYNDQFPEALNIGGKTGDFSMRAILDRFHANERDQFLVSSEDSLPIKWKQDRFELRYQPEIDENWKANLQFNHAYDKPWNAQSSQARELELLDPSTFPIYRDKHLVRNGGTGELIYHMKDEFSVLVGSNIYDEEGRGHEVTGEEVPDYDAFNQAYYAEVMKASSLATFTAGSRYELNSNFDPAFVSRLSATKAEDDWHAKAQLAQSFRSPGYENILSQFDPNDPNFELQPQKSVVAELELGHKLTEDAYFTATLFNIRAKDAIEYFFDPVNGDSYRNGDDVTGSRGAEANLRYVFDRGEINLNYAYHTATDAGIYSVFEADGVTKLDDDRFIGYSPHVASILGTVKLTQKYQLSSILRYTGSKYNYTSLTPDFTGIAEKLSPEYLWRITFIAVDFGIKNLELQLGINNVLNEDVKYGYGSLGHGPFPGLDREYYTSIIYRW